MNESKPSLLSRLSIGLTAFWRCLSDPEFAAELDRLRSGALAAARPEPSSPPAPRFVEGPPDSALQLLALLQQDGRFVDFVEEEVDAFSDAEVGAAARVVHEGCRKTIREHFTIVPIREELESARVTLPAGFDASAVRLTGNVVGEAPFVGSLVHRGWRAAEVKLPKVAEGHDVTVLAAAEVEM